MNFLLTLLLLGLTAARAQNSTAPSVAHPGTELFFQVQATGLDPESYDLDYEVLAAPTHTVAWPYSDRGAPVLVLHWTVSESLLGTNATFVIRATDRQNPSLRTTNVVLIAIQNPPPIHSIQMSNGLPVLTLTNLPPTAGYRVEFASSIPSTNWIWLLSVLSSTCRMKQ